MPEGLVETSLEEKVRIFLAKSLRVDPDRIRSETRFKEDLEADDFDRDMIFLILEEEFKIEFSPEEEEKIKRIQDVINCIKSKMQNAK